MAEAITRDRLQADIANHHAVQAWRRLHPESPEPTEVVILKKRFKSAVYRVDGVGPASSSIVAKSCQRETAAHERTVYEQILRHLPVNSPQYYGFLEGDGKRDWVFLEYAAGELYSRQRADHSVLVGRWLGLLHTLGARIPAARRLPKRGSAYYLSHLRAAREKFWRNLNCVELRAHEFGVVKAVISQCNFLGSRWYQVERWCESMPQTFVHGDFKPRNVVIRTCDGTPVVLPFDWEASGWGVPAEDLAYVDLAAYLPVVKCRWVGVDMADLQTMKIVGRILRGLSEFFWESVKFEPNWQVSTVKLEIYYARMAEAIQMAKWKE